jgi:hypothetical protein
MMPGNDSASSATRRDAQPDARLDAPFDSLRALAGAEGPLFEGGRAETPLAPGLSLNADPEAGIIGIWRSPRGRLLEIEATPKAPGAWFALHLVLPLPDLAGIGWLGFVARSSSDRAVAVLPCLRSGLATGGFHDCFFDRHILSRGQQTDHHDLIAPEWRPDLPVRAPWRELILFLPPTEPLHWALHDLRVFTL